MFSPVKMARLDVLLLKKDARAALRGLGRAGVLELAESAELAAVPGEKSGAVRDCESLLLRLRDLSRAAGAVTGPASGGLSFEEARAALENWEGALQGPLRLRGELAEKAAGFSAAAEKLAPYAGLPLPSAGKEFFFLYSAAGTLPAENLDALRAPPAG